MSARGEGPTSLLCASPRNKCASPPARLRSVRIPSRSDSAPSAPVRHWIRFGGLSRCSVKSPVRFGNQRQGPVDLHSQVRCASRNSKSYRNSGWREAVLKFDTSGMSSSSEGSCAILPCASRICSPVQLSLSHLPRPGVGVRDLNSVWPPPNLHDIMHVGNPFATGLSGRVVPTHASTFRMILPQPWVPDREAIGSHQFDETVGRRQHQ